uniref:(northern house mosquito) hypothetical protein n=1 Tax=Culex pipiens TaxID=7175 RepID=A0A8D8EWQ0_CULPI
MSRSNQSHIYTPNKNKRKYQYKLPPTPTHFQISQPTPTQRHAVHHIKESSMLEICETSTQKHDFTDFYKLVDFYQSVFRLDCPTPNNEFNCTLLLTFQNRNKFSFHFLHNEEKIIRNE